MRPRVATPSGVIVLSVDARGRVLEADAAARALGATPGAPAFRRGADLPTVLRAAGEGTAALAVANALAADGPAGAGEVTFIVHDASGRARARWRMLPLPGGDTGTGHRAAATPGAAGVSTREREPDGAPGRREAEAVAAVARELGERRAAVVGRAGRVGGVRGGGGVRGDVRPGGG